MYRSEPGEISECYQVTNEGLLTLPFGVVRLLLLVALLGRFANEISLHSRCWQVVTWGATAGAHLGGGAGESDRGMTDLFL